MKHRRLYSGLTGRILRLFLGLLLAVQVLGFLAIRQSIEANARSLLREELRVGERLLARLMAQRAEQLAQGASLLAADFGFRDAVHSDDLATVQSALDNQVRRIGAEVAAWLDPKGQVRAVSTSGGLALRRTLDLLGQQADGTPQLQQLTLVDGQVYQLVAVPMKAPLLVGWVVMGFPLGDQLPQDLHALTGLDMAWLLQAPGSAPRVLASSAQGLEGAALADWPLGVAQPIWRDQELLALAVPWLEQGQGSKRTLLRAQLWRAMDQAIAPYHRLQWLLLAITAGGLLVMVLGSVWTARAVTRPVQALVDASRRVGLGDFKTPVDVPPQDDEIAELAQAFEQMRLSVDAREDALQALAFRDPLTGLPNRARFSNVLASSLQASEGPLTLLVLNLDRLQQINNTLGYDAGNQVLQQVAQRLMPLAQDVQGMLARFGGDEFGLLCPQHGLADAESLAQKVHEALAQPLMMGDSPVDVATGIGVACFPAHGDQPSALLRHAEMALYEAKRLRTGTVLWRPDMAAGSAGTLSLLGELRRAVAQNELRLFLQPKLDIGAGQVVGAEALVRWQHPTRGMVPPLQFIPFAEETGFIHTLTLWVVEEAARLCAPGSGVGMPGRLSINLSAHDLAKADLVGQLNTRLARHGASPQALCLEITESAIMSDPNRAVSTLHALEAAGYKLSIDDFGTGYSSYATLKTLPVHELKIDMSFVRAMEREPKDAMIVRSIIDLAHNLGLSVVAEGVENEAILQRLTALGCNEAQGWHIGKPMPADEWAGWLRQRTTHTANAA